MKVNVKTVWGPGFVSVADKYVAKALACSEGLEISCKGATMSVPYEKLSQAKPREGAFTDKFGRKKEYKLFDFFWRKI
jgi:hypothetical protein